MPSAAANCDSALQTSQNNLSTPFIFDTPNNLTNRNIPRQPGVAHQLIPHQLYQLNSPYRSYQKNNKKEVYQISDKDGDSQPESFHIFVEQENKKVQYSDKGFDKMDANFICIETLYEKYGAPFSSNFWLDKHLKDYCISFLQPLPPGAYAPTLLIHIIISKSVIPAIGSGLAFQE